MTEFGELHPSFRSLVVSYHELCWVREQVVAGGRRSCGESEEGQRWAGGRWRCPWPACAGRPPPSCDWQTSCKLWPLSPGLSPVPGPEMGKRLSEYTLPCWEKHKKSLAELGLVRDTKCTAPKWLWSGTLCGRVLHDLEAFLVLCGQGMISCSI